MGTTNNITIEPLLPEHFALVAGWLSEPQNNEWLTTDWRGRIVDAMLVGIAARNKKNRLYLIRIDDMPCGVIALADIDLVDGVAMLWDVLGDKRHSGKGVMTQATRLMLCTAFDELNLHCIYAWIMADNVASRRVVEKAGFQIGGLVRSAACHHGTRVDRIYYDRLKTDK
jgi:RimJ/RimL family protein N-acetyltransferase